MAPASLAGASPQPGNGWRLGDPALTALSGGAFHATLTAEGACAWRGTGDVPYLWPEGYRVRFNPTELINPQGQVVAHEGDRLKVGGGEVPARPGERCTSVGKLTSYVQSNPARFSQVLGESPGLTLWQERKPLAQARCGEDGPD